MLVSKGIQEPVSISGAVEVKHPFKALVFAYRRSPEFRLLRDTTRRDYNRVLDWTLRHLPREDPALLEVRDVFALRDLAFDMHKRRFANYVIQVLRLLLRWGRERGYLERNVAEGIKSLKRPPGPRANRPWSDEERETVLAAASIELRSVIALGMYSGLREADACSLSRDAYDGDRIQVVAAKNQEHLVIRVHFRLRAVLDEAAIARFTKGQRRKRRYGGRKLDPHTLAVTSRGQSWTTSGFRASFFKLIKKLHANGQVEPGLTFHGLRHTLGKLVMEAGGAKEDIGLILGDRSMAMATYYSREHDKIGRTDAIVRQLEAVDLRKSIKPIAMDRIDIGQALRTDVPARQDISTRKGASFAWSAPTRQTPPALSQSSPNGIDRASPADPHSAVASARVDRIAG